MEKIDFLPLVKAYPALSQTYGEVSCVAGIELEEWRPKRWIRLYPVAYRALEDSQQFAKYQPITVSVESHSGDRRPETRRPDRDSIALLGDPISSANGWVRRRPFVEPLMAESMCAITRSQKSDGVSLGIFRPRVVKDLKIVPAEVSAEKRAIAKAWAAQPTLLDGLNASQERDHQVRELEAVPWSFKYHYFCHEGDCGGHTQTIIDWEIALTYRRVRNRPDWHERMRKRWLEELCAPDRDVALIVGNMHQHPGSFLVLGVWWPERRPRQLELRDL